MLHVAQNYEANIENPPVLWAVLGNTARLIVELGLALHKHLGVPSPAMLCVDIENCFLPSSSSIY